MSFADIRQAIYSWVRTETNLTVIWKDQAEARPPRPYVALKLISGPRKRGHDDLRQAAGVFEVHGQRHWTCSIEILGSGAMDTAMQLQTSLEDPSIQEALSAKGLAYKRAENAQDLSKVLDTSIESRAQMDVFFTSSTLRVTTVAPIEDVSGTNEIDGEEFTVNT